MFKTQTAVLSHWSFFSTDFPSPCFFTCPPYKYHQDADLITFIIYVANVALDSISLGFNKNKVREVTGGKSQEITYPALTRLERTPSFCQPQKCVKTNKKQLRKVAEVYRRVTEWWGGGGGGSKFVAPGYNVCKNFATLWSNVFTRLARITKELDRFF